MAKNFSELEAKMSPESIERSNQYAHELKIQMLNMALESQSDMQVSTLQRLIEALGGNLELIAHLPEGDVRITQFDRRTA